MSERRSPDPDDGPATPRRGRSAGGNLPAELNSFVGRRRELADIKRLTSGFRLVTLCGMGGVGKTRLALRTAGLALRAFPDGAWFVDLAELVQSAPAAMRQAPGSETLAHLVATELGLPELSAHRPVQSLCDHLAPRCLLLVLDNCEHLVPTCAALVNALLHACPDLRIVATSREPLGLTGEVTYPVQPLPTPDPILRPGYDVTGCDSVTLFVARAEAVQPGFRLTSDKLAEVVDICRRLDGLPLAIELAAARLRVLTAPQIAARLIDRFALLSNGGRNVPDRQHSLRNCMDWSFELCEKPEQRLWARLSVFSGSFELDAVEGICAGEDLVGADLLDLTASLIDKSVLGREDHGPVVRYRMLETVRAYGNDRLRASGEYAVLLRRHRDWYEELVERADSEWIGDRQAYWLDRLNQERAELRQAVEVCLTEAGGAERALRVAMCLPPPYWSGQGPLDDARGWLDRALARSPAPTALRARALLLASRLAFAGGDEGAWKQLLDEGTELAQHLDDAAALSFATFLRGTAALFADDVHTAVELLERTLTVLAQQPRKLLDQRLHVLSTLVAAAGLAGDQARAATCYEEIMEITEPRGEGFHRANAMWASGLVAWRRGDLEAAAAHQTACLRLRQQLGIDDPLGTALCLTVLAWIEAGREPRRAAVLLGAADARWTDLGESIGSYPLLAAGQEPCERQTCRVLDEPAYHAAHSHGRSLTPADSVAYALQEHPEPAVPKAPDSELQLTRREEEVAVLVARGLSNRDIAKSLVISQRTAESHVANILTKQGFTSRSQIAAWIAEQST